uniref:Uncharacterized protein n=1 Tax=Glossina pallidipes TaxID=7398 RepID=A0A1A9ZKF9_GLOPL
MLRFSIWGLFGGISLNFVVIIRVWDYSRGIAPPNKISYESGVENGMCAIQGYSKNCSPATSICHTTTTIRLIISSSNVIIVVIVIIIFTIIIHKHQHPYNITIFATPALYVKPGYV